MRRAALAAFSLLGVTLVAACSSGASTTTTAPPATTRPTPSTEARPTTTVVVTLPIPGVSTLPAPPTTSAATLAATAPPPATVTTTAAGPACDAGTLFAVLQGATSLPSDTGAEAPLCAGAWATMVVGAPNQDRALAVFTFEGSTAWRLANIGTDQVCSGAAVPTSLYGALGCAQWETE